MIIHDSYYDYFQNMIGSYIECLAFNRLVVIYLMREIINLQLGQCGNHIADQFLSRIILEHGIDPEGQYIGQHDIQKERVDVYLNEVADGSYMARSVLVDLEPGTIDVLRGQKMGKLYNCDNFVVGLGSAGNNWAVGYYGRGSELIEIMMDAVRKQSEMCDHLQGFQMFHSLSGGTGSGLGSLLLERLYEDYQGRMFQTFSVFPSLNIQSNILESYNSVFSLHALKEKADMCHTLQNEAIESICIKTQKIQKPNYKDLNQVVALAASDITCGIRFPGQINSSLRKMAMNLVPFRNLKFLVSSAAPLYNRSDYILSTKQILSSLFDKHLLLAHSQNAQKCYKVLTGSAIFRGDICFHELQNFLLHFQTSRSYQLAQSLQNYFQYSICNYSPPDRAVAATLVSNNKCIKLTFQNMKYKYSSLFKRKAYVHWYTNEGLEEMEFLEMESKLADLVVDYEWWFDESEVLEQQPQ